jgi:hypothetical protein
VSLKTGRCSRCTHKRTAARSARGLGDVPRARTPDGAAPSDAEAHILRRPLRVFGAASRMMKQNGIIYVRTDRRAFTYRTTVEVLRETFPHKKLLRRTRPAQGPSQTQLFGNEISQPGEVDLILLP